MHDRGKQLSQLREMNNRDKRSRPRARDNGDRNKRFRLTTKSHSQRLATLTRRRHLGPESPPYPRGMFWESVYTHALRGPDVLQNLRGPKNVFGHCGEI